MSHTRMQRLIATVLAAALSGCAMTPTYFRANESRLSNFEVCRTWQGAAQGSDYTFAADVARSANMRGLDRAQCDQLVTDQKRKAAAVVGALLLIGAGVAAARSSGGGGGYYAPRFQPSAVDVEWDWDQFRDQQGLFVWACRGVQTGQFATHDKCFGRLQTDFRWPGPNL